MAQLIQLVEVNPNDVTGGGGCLCSPIKGHDTKGPFFVFPATETESNLSPHAVVCAGCVKGCSRRLAKKEKPLVGGEKDNTAELEI
jgi:hypothetical protein